MRYCCIKGRFGTLTKYLSASTFLCFFAISLMVNVDNIDYIFLNRVIEMKMKILSSLMKVFDPF